MNASSPYYSIRSHPNSDKPGTHWHTSIAVLELFNHTLAETILLTRLQCLHTQCSFFDFSLTDSFPKLLKSATSAQFPSVTLFQTLQTEVDCFVTFYSPSWYPPNLLNDFIKSILIKFTFSMKLNGF